MIKQKQRGAVSIFIVVFTALLVTIVTTSFMQIMIGNQRQASNSDLSKSAYDSALAGVEDAKRALVALKKCQITGSNGGACASLKTALVGNNGQSCETLGSGASQAGVTTFTNHEVKVQNAQSNLDQAYTCVKVTVNTKSYQSHLSKGAVAVIPLDTVGDPNAIKQVRISWFQQGDLAANPSPTFVTPVGSLPIASKWAVTTPPIMRSQLIQFQQGNLDITQFDKAGYAQSLFLYPATGLPAATADFGSDQRRQAGGTNAPYITSCAATFAASPSSYLCQQVINIPDVPSLPANGKREAYLQLQAIYNGADYMVELLNGSGTIIDFDNVQPIVDSTGRANTQFRRVQARVSISKGGVPTQYPDAALSLQKDICKDFFVTNDAADYDGDADKHIPACSSE
jgi:Tfp pilus assembly protein PilX